ncbi:MAG: hypothetical protein AB7I04_01825 [Pseudomonadales bacterium]
MDDFSFHALHVHPYNDSDLSDHPRWEQLRGWLPPTWEGRQLKLKIVTENGRSLLLDSIYRGELWAIGFVTKPGGFDVPMRIPREYFFVDYDHEGGEIPDRAEFYDKGGLEFGRGSIHWRKGELIVEDTTYFDIRVVRPPPDTEAYEEQEGVPNGLARRERSAQGGRPNSSREIAEMAEVLLEDPEFLNLPDRKEQARELRARLFGEDARYQDHRPGYGTDHIRRIIGRVANSKKGK